MLENLFFDWYSASIDATPDYIISLLKPIYPLASLEPARPQNGFTHADKLVNQYGETIVTLWYGGSRQGTNTFVFASGQNADFFAYRIRELFPDHELVRADVAIDYEEKGAYLSLVQHGIKSSRGVSVKNKFIGQAGSEFAPDHPDGRSLYLGSRSSVSMIRIYEKGKKDDKTRPDWVRAEFEFKPKGFEARQYYAKASVQQIIGATKLGVAFFPALGLVVKSSPVPPGTVRIKSDHDRAMQHLVKQYRKTLLAELDRNGGSYELLGMTLIHGAA